MKNTPVYLFVILSLAISLGHCQTIEIAFFDRGRTADWRQEIINKALDAAIEKYQAELKKAELEIKIKNYTVPRGDVTQVLEVTSAAVKSLAVVAIGHDLSRHASLATQTLEGSDLLLISPFATATSLTNSKNIFLTAGTNRETAQAIEAFINTQFNQGQTLFIVPWNDPYSKDFYDDFSVSFKEKGTLIKILKEETNFQKLAEENKNYHKIILLTYPMQTASLIRSFNQSNKDAIFFGPDSWGETNDSKEQITPITNGLKFKAYTLRKYSKHRMSEGEAAFSKELSQKTQGNYSVVAALYFDSMSYIIENLLRIGKNADRKNFTSYARKNNHYSGISGDICFIPERCRLKAPFHIIQLDGTGFKYHDSILLQ
jgi:ABC-type branched-subunit amino acid transport system substrate-binding protein